MEIEDVSRICFTSGRTSEDQRDLAICDRLLREVVIYDKRMSSRVTEIFSDGGAGERCIILQCSRVSGCRGNDDGIIKCAFFLESLHDAGDRRSFLTYGHVYAIYRFAGEIGLTLIDDSVDCDRGLSCLSVADDQLTLASAYRNHGVDSLQAGLKRFRDRLTEDNSRSLPFKRHFTEFPFDASFAVKRLAERIHNTSNHGLTYIDGCYPARTAHGHSFLDPVGRTEQHSAHIILFEIHDHRLDIIVELQKFSCLGIEKALDPYHSVTHLQDMSDLLELKVRT